MAGVINDIEALAEFRAHLMRFNHDLAENFATIQSHWRELGEVWRDDMYRLFGEALEHGRQVSDSCRIHRIGFTDFFHIAVQLN